MSRKAVSRCSGKGLSSEVGAASDLSAASPLAVDRRDFMRVAGVGSAGLAFGGWGLVRQLSGAASAQEATPESFVQELYDLLSAEQKNKVCFAWDYLDPDRGLLRTHVANNWQITEQPIESEFYSERQRQLVRKIFEGIVQPDWQGRIDKQLQDDAGGWGKQQSLAIFGQPGNGKFEFVLTGRHMTMRCDGNSTDHMAFGGPIFYGHAAQGFNEEPDHPGNVYWPQAVAANSVFGMLEPEQKKIALVEEMPYEAKVGFKGSEGAFEGIRVGDLSSDQQQRVQEVLQKLLEPYRQAERDEVNQCLASQGGLDDCHMVFYKEEDLGEDQVWDNWRLEGPSFVWHFRGAPHVHVWVNIGDSPDVQLNAGG